MLKKILAWLKYSLLAALSTTLALFAWAYFYERIDDNQPFRKALESDYKHSNSNQDLDISETVRHFIPVGALKQDVVATLEQNGFKSSAVSANGKKPEMLATQIDHKQFPLTLPCKVSYKILIEFINQKVTKTQSAVDHLCL